MIERLRGTPAPRIVAGTHAAYLVTTGVWPLVHRDSFERVTGRKREFWLVRLVGALAGLMGATLGIAAARGKQTPEVRMLAVGSTLVFGVADLAATKRYSRVYLADTAVQALFASAWLVGWRRADEAEQERRPARFLVRPLRILDDALVERRVRSAGNLPEDVEVEVQDGVVTLRGEIDERMAAGLVERIAVARGVRGVDPHLAVGS
jgi:BON domain